MNEKHNVRTAFPFLALAVLFLASLACGTSPSASTQTTKENGQDMVQVESSKTPKPSATPTSVPIGLSRVNPSSYVDSVSAPNWNVQVIEVKRGEVAWQEIKSANIYNEAAPEGMEYLLVKIHVKSTYTDSDAHSIGGCDFDVTGDRLINYTCMTVGVVEPDPQLDASLFSGGETEGWAAFLVAQGEGNLILVVDETFNFDTNAKRYIALDDGASISIPSDLLGIQPTDSGKDRNAPAPRTEKIITEDWELLITDVIRGDEAWKMVQEANQFNDPPVDGFEYIAVKIHARNIDTEDKPSSIDGTFFKSTGSAGILYDAPSVVDPSPQLDISLYPGGEYDGWIVVQASLGETNMAMVFEPLFDFSDNNRRFIALEP